MRETGANSQKLLGWVPVVLLAALVLLGRVPDLFTHYHDWDEATTMAQAWAMTRGQVLYKDIPLVHPVLHIALMVPFFHIVRPEMVPLAVKTMNLCLVFLGALLIGKIASRWLARPELGFLGGCIFIFYCSRPWALSSFGEFYFILPVLLSVWFLNFVQRPRSPTYYAVGILWGVAFFLKQVAAFDAAGLYLGYLCMAPTSKQSKVAATGLMALGFLSVAASISTYFLYRGALSDAWHSMFVRALFYSHSGGVRWYLLLTIARGIFAQLGLSLPAIAGVVYLILHRPNRPGTEELVGAPFFLALLIWLCSDLVGLYAVGRFYNYYLLELVPLASLLPLFIVNQMEAQVRNAVRISLLLMLALVLCVDFAHDMWDLRSEHWVPLQVRQSAAAADFIKKHTREDDRIFVYRASNVDVFFLAQRLSNNGIYQYFDMVGWHVHDPSIQEQKRREFLSHPPAIIVVDPEPADFLSADAFLDNVLTRDYALETTVEGLQLYARIRE